MDERWLLQPTDRRSTKRWNFDDFLSCSFSLLNALLLLRLFPLIGSLAGIAILKPSHFRFLSRFCRSSWLPLWVRRRMYGLSLLLPCTVSRASIRQRLSISASIEVNEQHNYGSCNSAGPRAAIATTFTTICTPLRGANGGLPFLCARSNFSLLVSILFSCCLTLPTFVRWYIKTRLTTEGAKGRRRLKNWVG